MPIIQTNKPLRKRDEHDYYPTPEKLAGVMFDLYGQDRFLGTNSYLNMLDPGSGYGVFGKVGREKHPLAHITGVELDTKKPSNLAYDTYLYKDYLNLSTQHTSNHNLIIGNPPYKLAEQFIWKSVEFLAFHGVIMFLLRLNFLEGIKRNKGIYTDFKPTSIYVLAERPSFTGNNKTDATAYAIFVWDTGKNMKVDTTLKFLSWK